MPKKKISTPGLTIKVTTIDKQTDIPASATAGQTVEYLNVGWEISQDGEVVASGFNAFPLETTPDELEAALLKKKETHESDTARAAANKEVEAAHKNADKVIVEMTGKEL